MTQRVTECPTNSELGRSGKGVAVLLENIRHYLAIWVYAGFGSNDFPYYGRPYGSPSDPWSWPAMAGYAHGVPTRFNLVLP